MMRKKTKEKRNVEQINFLPFGTFFAFLFTLDALSPINSRNSDRGAHINSRLVSPLPTPSRALHFYRWKSFALSSLVNSRLIAAGIRCQKDPFYQPGPQQYIIISYHIIRMSRRKGHTAAVALLLLRLSNGTTDQVQTQ